MAANSNLHAAKAAKNDEFYTRYEDINAEINTMEHGYRPHFKDAVVYCNCDDPEWSNFWKFFKDRFHAFGLKKLISTHYEKDGSSSYMLEFDGTKVTKSELEGNGDFRSDECIELLKRADIVVTNPPFSLFREYVAQLMKYGKKFIVLSNPNAITYKEVFPLIKDNKMWNGYKSMGSDMYFIVSDEHAKILVATKKEGSGYKVIDGKVFGRTQAIWFTNLDIPKRHEHLKLGQCYYGYEDRYPKYDNYDAINVDKVAEIPGDYDGVMGVPITFMDKFCPEQFEIIGHPQSGILPVGWKGICQEFVNLYYAQGNKGAIREGWINPVYINTAGKAIIPYQRILICRKKGSTS